MFNNNNSRYLRGLCASSIAFFLTASVCVLSIESFAQTVDSGEPDFKDIELSFRERAEDLVGRMTLEEKVPQLMNDAPAITRLGVREYNWWNEGLHGVAAAGYATVFPQAIGMAATWNEELMGDIADVISVEFRAKYVENQHRFGGTDWFGGLTVWSPNINIFRDPRWGRGQETYGEDPHLTSRLGVAFVKGLQGDDKYLRTVATPKHYAVHSGPEASRHQDDIHPSAKDLEETYLPAFEATIREGKAVSIMCAYNAVDGVPACASKALMQETLRDNWGFNGFVVSDCGAVMDVYTEDHHGYADTPEKGVALSLEAGMDLICGGNNEIDHIHKALEVGLLSEEDIDRALIRLFTARMQLGQFDPRHLVFPKITSRDNDTDANRKVALQAAEESLVLLKNKNQFLPFKTAPKKLAVIGPNADSHDALVGNYNGSPSQPSTVLSGIKARFTDSEIIYEQGSGLLDPIQFPVPDEYLCRDKKCRKAGLNTEHFNNQSLEGKPIANGVESNVSVEWQGEVRFTSARWQGYIKAPESGRYTFRYKAHGGYRIWVDDTLVIDAWKVDWRPVIGSGAIELKANQSYKLKIESFQRGEDGDEQLVWSTPSDAGLQSALSAAESADVVVFVGGLTAQVEGEEMPVPLPGFSGGDKTRLDLPETQELLLQKLFAKGKPVVVVLMNGSAMSVNEIHQQADAVIEAWYPGGQGGEAVAGLLAGDFSPAGRLPLTFYRSMDQLPPFKDYSMKNRTYRYFSGEVLYPFGYGLSFTEFSYSKLKISSKKVNGAKGVTVSVELQNTGDMDGDEVVQLYLSRPDIEGSPIRSLVGFKRVHLAKGEKQSVEFKLDSRALSTVDDNGERKVVPGEVIFWLGGGQPIAQEGLKYPPGIVGQFKIEKGLSL